MLYLCVRETAVLPSLLVCRLRIHVCMHRRYVSLSLSLSIYLSLSLYIYIYIGYMYTYIVTDLL